MTVPIEFHQAVVLTLLVLAIVSFVWERLSLELTSLLLLVALLLWFQIAPLEGPDGAVLLDPERLLSGFANPLLLAVLALLVMGQAMVQTGALSGLARIYGGLSKRRPSLSVAMGFSGVLVISAFLNNTPVVVMFIPIMQTLALHLRWSTSSLMMPLSFAAILGGMTTVVGSSTNMLVSSSLRDLDLPALGIFEFTLLGAAMAAVGAVYVVFLLPKLLPHRTGMAGTLVSEGKQFMAEIDVQSSGKLIGARSLAGIFRELPDVTVRMIQRGELSILPPFDDVSLAAGDVLIVAATRPALTEALRRNSGFILTPDRDPMEQGHGDPDKVTERVVAEVMIAPASRMIDQTIDMVGFRRRFGCLVLGIQRRGRMARRRIGDIRLEAGDVLLIAGRRAAVNAFSQNSDLVLMTWSTRDLPQLQRAPHAIAIFMLTIAVASTELLPISVAAILGAVVMLAVGCLNLRQAIRALDRTVVLLVGATLALGAAMEETGAAGAVAHGLVGLMGRPDPVWGMVMMFGLVALTTNLISNNACAVLFTPIGVNMATDLGIDPLIMAITVLLAANCSFATPIGYQTNLLVMGPGHYRFADFIRGGLPLVALMWLTFSLLAPIYFGV
ncbi:MAG: SLC13 family permease [Rhodospirillaceae bacterium]|nr:SLC13 family permease [Rhodospirillaceae bacterium]MCA8931876.1 SLC13 family permease [Rhodospirillaceae bacterium]